MENTEISIFETTQTNLVPELFSYIHIKCMHFFFLFYSFCSCS